MAYNGQERRFHRVLRTKNTEYHMRGAVCVAVKLADNGWHDQHEALGAELEGSIGISTEGSYEVTVGSEPTVGQRLCFGELLTSSLCEIDRPPKSDVAQYRVTPPEAAASA